MSEIIRVDSLYKTFKLDDEEINVLKDINLSINKGEFVSIMGPSGSGKSTLLYMLSALDKISSGKVLIDGKDISTLRDGKKSAIRRKYFGFVFQFYNLVPNLNVEDNIMLPVLLDGRDMRDYEESLDEILQIVGLDTRRKHLPNQLSGGQQQRVAIARALINDPEIIFADEPIGNVDSVNGKNIMELFETINKVKGKTIVQVTHSEEAARYGTRIIRIKDGGVYQDENI